MQVRKQQSELDVEQRSRRSSGLVAQSCLTLCDPTDCRPSGSSLHGISQARILEWVTISLSGDLPDPGIEPKSPALQADSLPFELQGRPYGTTDWFQIGKGVHQGCILSHCLFNSYAEYLIRNASLDEAQAGIKTTGRNINNLRCVDDTTIVQKAKKN